MKKKWIPILVILAMLFTMPGMAFAEEETYEAETLRLSLTGHADGFGDADVWISGTAVDLYVDDSWEDTLRFGVDAVIGGSDPIHAVVDADKEGLWIALPGLVENKYFVSYETLTNVFGDKADELGINVAINPEAPMDFLADIDTDALAESFGEYMDIITGIATDENTVRTSGDYELAGLGETVSADVVTLTPTQEDWNKVLGGLLTKLQSDEMLMNLIEAGVVESSKDNEEASPEETMDFIRDMIASGAENAEMFASFVAGTSFTLVSTEDGVVALKVEMPDMFSVGYEGFGSLDDTRRDAIVSYGESGAEILALNTVGMDENGVSGKLTIDMLDVELRYAFGDGNPYFGLYAGMGEEVGAQLTVEDADDEGNVLVEAVYDAFDAETQEEKLAVIDLMIATDDTVVELPEGDFVELETEDDIREAVEEIGNAIAERIGVEVEAAA